MARIASISLSDKAEEIAVAPSASKRNMREALRGVDAREDGEEIAVQRGSVRNAGIAERGREDRAERADQNQRCGHVAQLGPNVRSTNRLTTAFVFAASCQGTTLRMLVCIAK